MFMGVTLDFFVFAGGLSLCLYILLASFSVLIFYVCFHLLASTACCVEPCVFHLLTKRLLCLRVPNYSTWGVQSYEPF